MSFASSHAVAFTTDANGDVVVYTPVVSGRVLEVRYTYGDAATGTDFAIVGNISGKAILTITNAGTSSLTWQPRQPIQPVANTAGGTNLTYDGTRLIYEPIWIAGESIKITVDEGGNAKDGTLTFIIG